MDPDEIERRLEAGHTAAQVAASARVTERTIRNWLHRGGRQLSRERSQSRRREQAAQGRGLLSDPDWLGASFATGDVAAVLGAMHPEIQWNEAEGFLPCDGSGRSLQICGMTGTTAVMTAPQPEDHDRALAGDTASRPSQLRSVN